MMRAKYKSRVAAGLAASVFVGLMWMADEPADFHSEDTITIDGTVFSLNDPLRRACWQREDGTFLRLQHLQDAPAGLEVPCDTLKGE